MVEARKKKNNKGCRGKMRERGKRNFDFYVLVCHVSLAGWSRLAPLAGCHLALLKRGENLIFYYGRNLSRFACQSSSLNFSRFSTPNEHGFQR